MILDLSDKICVPNKGNVPKSLIEYISCDSKCRSNVKIEIKPKRNKDKCDVNV